MSWWVQRQRLPIQTAASGNGFRVESETIQVSHPGDDRVPDIRMESGDFDGP
ncbi:MAG: hypothetical protein WCK86_02005 [Planctomycetia bacterium]